MAAYISFQPTDFFTPKLYTGTAATNSITGVGFTPNFVWFKGRSGSISHQLYDTVRGNASALVSSSTAAPIDATGDGFTSLDADGYTFNSSGGGGNVNGSGSTYVAWNWKAGTTSVPSGGTITPSAVSINTTSGFGVYQFTGNSTGGATFAHGLGAAPKLVIVKNLVSGSDAWNVNLPFTSLGSTGRLYLNTTSANSAAAAAWNSTVPTSTLITLGSNGETNASNAMIFYAFTPIRGYSAFGEYEGNGNVDGPFIYTGFRPAFVMIKNIDRSEAWDMYDTKRNPFNLGTSKLLQANSDVAENATSTIDIDILSNGFKVRTTSTEINLSTAVYAAFAEFPFVSSNSKAGVAR